MNGQPNHARASQAGFTLIELLVVMAILATLAGLGVVGLPMMMQRGDKLAVKSFISSLTAQLEAYKGTTGGYPPTVLQDFSGVGPVSNFENCGNEAVVLCLQSRNYSGGQSFEDTQKLTLENVDHDFTQAQLTRYGTKDLFELHDAWGTPYAYFSALDYTRAGELGFISGPGNEVLKVKPWMNPVTKSFYRKDSFQIISAGPDGIFNTDDDICNFEHE